jgi:A/G-specific adenine glycosylase
MSTTTPASRKASAQDYLSSLSIGEIDMSEAVHVAAFPPLVHIFTHIRLTMHVHQFSIACDNLEDVTIDDVGPPARRLVKTDSMSKETLSTGMRKCWDLIAKSD